MGERMGRGSALLGLVGDGARLKNESLGGNGRAAVRAQPVPNSSRNCSGAAPTSKANPCQYIPKHYNIHTIIKKLTRTDNNVTLGLNKQLLAAANLDPRDPVEVSTNGRVIVIAPVRTKRDADKLARGTELMHAKYAGAFRRLAK